MKLSPVTTKSNN